MRKFSSICFPGLVLLAALLSSPCCQIGTADSQKSEDGQLFVIHSYHQPSPVIYFSRPYGRYARLNKPLPMADQAFTGERYYLVDGMCFSTTGHLTFLLKYHGFGTFIGEETGTTCTCNDASHDTHLKNTGYRLQSARYSFATAVTGFPLNRGILPDHPVRETLEDLISGNDAVLGYALDLINQSQADDE
jgi:hypothetical protein